MFKEHTLARIKTIIVTVRVPVVKGSSAILEFERGSHWNAVKHVRDTIDVVRSAFGFTVCTARLAQEDTCEEYRLHSTTFECHLSAGITFQPIRN